MSNAIAPKSHIDDAALFVAAEAKMIFLRMRPVATNGADALCAAIPPHGFEQGAKQGNGDFGGRVHLIPSPRNIGVKVQLAHGQTIIVDLVGGIDL